MLVTACSGQEDDGIVDIAFIGDSNDPFESSLRLSPAGQHVRSATIEGLVALDANGDLVPALAERWIVTDDGLSYIFRLRNSKWPDGTAMTGQAVRDSLIQTKRTLRGTSLGLDLAQIDEILAMTGRVVEIRLENPMPDFLQLLTQPELGIVHSGSSIGPLKIEQEEDLAILDATDPALRAQPETENWADGYRQIRVRAMAAQAALDAFANGEQDVVLNGTLANLPLVDAGPLTRGTIRLDPALGLFGLQVQNERGLLAQASLREAVAMAIDRSDLLTPFNIGGLTPVTRIMPNPAGEVESLPAERWTGLSMDERRADARRRVLIWRAANDQQDGELLPLTVALPAGPGSDILLRELANDLEPIGIGLVPSEPGTQADLRLVDRTARFSDMRWYLNQFNCGLDNGICSTTTDDLVAEALLATDAQARADFLAEAEAALVDSNAFIPLGTPIRWSLVRGQIEGFEENVWGIHPLFPFARRTN